MRTLPRGKSEVIAFMMQRAPIWAADPAAIGLSADQAQQVSEATQAAAGARAEVARLQAELAAAVITQDSAIDELRHVAGRSIQIIGAYAGLTGDDDVYAAAQLPLPKDPAPIYPEAPDNIRFELLNDGSLQLTWRGSQRGGASFAIRRSIAMADGRSTPMTWLAHTATSRYIDCTIPPGAVSASYMISALKGGREAHGPTLRASFTCTPLQPHPHAHPHAPHGHRAAA